MKRYLTIVMEIDPDEPEARYPNGKTVLDSPLLTEPPAGGAYVEFEATGDSAAGRLVSVTASEPPTTTITITSPADLLGELS